MSYTLLKATPGDETGYAGDAVAGKTLTEAIDAAKAQAEVGGPGTTVLIDHGDEVTVTSVTYRPDRPKFLGLDASNQAILEWPTEWRVVTDSSYVEQVFDEETGEETARSTQGSIDVTEEAPSA